MTEPLRNDALRPGDVVRVDDRVPDRHCRVPLFLRGRTGRISHRLGSFKDPEKLAYYEDGLPKRVLYKVVFRQDDVWPDYAGPPGDTVTADIYEHWLEPAKG